MLYRANDPSENVSETFLKRIMSEYFSCMKERNDLFELYKTRMVISDLENEQFKQATVCHICDKPFNVGDIQRSKITVMIRECIAVQRIKSVI